MDSILQNSFWWQKITFFYKKLWNKKWLHNFYSGTLWCHSPIRWLADMPRDLGLPLHPGVPNSADLPTTSTYYADSNNKRMWSLNFRQPGDQFRQTFDLLTSKTPTIPTTLTALSKMTRPSNFDPRQNWWHLKHESVECSETLRLKMRPKRLWRNIGEMFPMAASPPTHPPTPPEEEDLCPACTRREKAA